MWHALSECSLGLWGILCGLALFGALGIVVYEAARFGALRALKSEITAGSQRSGPVD